VWAHTPGPRRRDRESRRRRQDCRRQLPCSFHRHRTTTPRRAPGPSHVWMASSTSGNHLRHPTYPTYHLKDNQVVARMRRRVYRCTRVPVYQCTSASKKRARIHGSRRATVREIVRPCRVRRGRRWAASSSCCTPCPSRGTPPPLRANSMTLRHVICYLMIDSKMRVLNVADDTRASNIALNTSPTTAPSKP